MSSRVLPANVRCEGTTSSAGAGTSTEHTDTAGSTLKATRGPTPLQLHAAPAPVLPAMAMECLSSPHRLQDAEARLEQAAATRGTSRVRYNTLGDDTTDMNNIVVGEMNDARTPRAALLHGPRHGGRRGGATRIRGEHSLVNNPLCLWSTRICLQEQHSPCIVKEAEVGADETQRRRVDGL